MHALGEEPRLRDVATKLVLWAIEFIDDAQACPCCTLGHEPEEVEMFSMHDEGCPFQGFERTVDVEKLRAWASGAPAVPAETAIDLVNDFLHVDAVRTTRGNEIKCWTHDEQDGGRVKTYLDAKDCFELAECFEAIGAALRVSTAQDSK